MGLVILKTQLDTVFMIGNVPFLVEHPTVKHQDNTVCRL